MVGQYYQQLALRTTKKERMEDDHGTLIFFASSVQHENSIYMYLLRGWVGSGREVLTGEASRAFETKGMLRFQYYIPD